MSLFKAIRNEDLSLFQELLENPLCDLNQIDRNGYTPLHYAVLYNQPEMVQALCQKNVNLNMQNKFQHGPLHYTYDSDIIILKMLLEFGANANLQNDCGATALQDACYLGLQNNIELLLNYGADETIKNNFNQTVFDFCEMHVKEFIQFVLISKELRLLWEINNCD